MLSIGPCINTVHRLRDPLGEQSHDGPIVGRKPVGQKARWEAKRRSETLTSTAICDTGSIWFGK